MRSLRPSFNALLLCSWFLISFGGIYFARDLQKIVIAGWPLGYWFAAQGGILFFILIVAVFAWRSNRMDRSSVGGFDAVAYSVYTNRIHRRFLIYAACLFLFLLTLYFAESFGLSKKWVGAVFLISTVVLYAFIGIYCRTSDESEYYVAGRRIPAFYNGMAAAADWMSAASFISMAGGLYLQGFSGTETHTGGLAYILGWTGGFCLVALLVAPHLRKLNLNTIPDFFALRYGGIWPRRLSSLAAVLCSFTYVVAQIYGVGLITSRLTGVQFEIGILLGLGGVLVCSFLGGMRAVTWTQVSQYMVLILAFLIPVSWLSYKQLGNPLAPFVYGQQLEKITQLEKELLESPSEQQVIDIYARRAAELKVKLQNVEQSLLAERLNLEEKLRILSSERGDSESVYAARNELKLLPKNSDIARDVWTRALAENLLRAKPLGGMPAHSQPFAGDPNGSPREQQVFQSSRWNFLALMFCLMIGTAGLPHLLTRFYTTASVSETRSSVAWALFFISILYLCVPALAVMVKFEVMSDLVGQRFDTLPAWMAQWAKVDTSLLSINDVNGDEILQFSELRLGPDIVMLATPELGGFPYVVSGLVAAGGLAAALSTADGLLLTIGNAIGHDLFAKSNAPNNRIFAMRRVMLSKFIVLIVALIAAFAASQKSTDILYLVTSSFSLAGSAFVPAMVMGIYSPRTSKFSALLGMVFGMGLSAYYMLINATSVRNFLNLQGSGLWFDIQPISAGIFGVVAGFFVIMVTNLISASLPMRQ